MESLSSAAIATGKSKSTIFRAIKSGKLSASVKNDGTYQIEPAELFRVFQPVSPGTSKKYPMAQSETPMEQVKAELLRELLQQVQNERDDLRRRLDAATAEHIKASAEIRRLTLMIAPPSEVQLPAMDTETLPGISQEAHIHEPDPEQVTHAEVKKVGFFKRLFGF